jgi:polar amino acid transport system substrate-binding protein
MLRHLFSLFLLLIALLPPTQAAPLRVCMSEVPHQPWRLAERDGRVRERGLDFELLRNFQARSGRELQLRLHAGLRCLVELELGRADVGIGFSHTAERARYLRYPQRQGRPDASLALRVDSYYLFQADSGAWRWQGGRLLGNGRIGAQPGSAVAAWLRDAGLPVDEGERLPLRLMQGLLDGRFEAIALHGGEADSLQLQNPALAQLRRLQPALLRRPYYVVFSAAYAATHEADLAPLWRQFAEAAQFPAYQRAARGAGGG